MLNAEQIQENKMKYLDLMSKLNFDMTSISKYLDEVDYFTKPVTAANFRSYPGGLCKYALDLHNMLRQLCNAFFPNMYSEEDILKVSLFRDLYRACAYESYLKNVKDDVTGQWNSVQAYKSNEDKIPYGDIGFSSYMIAKKFVDFTDEQIEAICFSHCSVSQMDSREVKRHWKLVTLTVMADIAISNFISEK